jgi:hypothetical protein
MLQVARFLIKSLANLQKGKKLPESIKYLEHLKKGTTTATITDIKSLQCPYTIQKILVLHSCGKTQAAGQKIAQGLG